MSTRMQRANYIDKRLEELYPNPPIPLTHSDPYTLLIAVMLSARSTDACVNRISPILFEHARCPEEMVRLTPSFIQSIIRPCGLSPFKSRSIHAVSQILLDQYDGKVPASFQALESFPGVGHKTASVVMTQAFGIPAFPIDTHIYRLARRWDLTRAKSVSVVERDLKKLFHKNRWHDLHLQFIYCGREHCSARGCRKDCLLCREIQSL